MNSFLSVEKTMDHICFDWTWFFYTFPSYPWKRKFSADDLFVWHQRPNVPPFAFSLKKNSSIIIYFLDKWKQNSSYAKVGPSRSINIHWEEKNNNKKLSVVRCFISPSPVDIIFHASSSKCELNRLWGGRRQIEKKTHTHRFLFLAGLGRHFLILIFRRLVAFGCYTSLPNYQVWKKKRDPWKTLFY